MKKRRLKIIGILIIVCFLCIRLFKIFHKDTSNDQHTKESTEKDELESTEKDELENTEKDKIENIHITEEQDLEINDYYMFSDSDYKVTKDLFYPLDKEIKLNKIDNKNTIFLIKTLSDRFKESDNIVKIFIICDFMINNISLDLLYKLIVGINKQKTFRYMNDNQIYGLTVIINNLLNSLYSSKQKIIHTINQRTRAYTGFDISKKIFISNYQYFFIDKNKSLIKKLVENSTNILSDKTKINLLEENIITDKSNISPIEFMFAGFFEYYLVFLKVV